MGIPPINNHFASTGAESYKRQKTSPAETGEASGTVYQPPTGYYVDPQKTSLAEAGEESDTVFRPPVDDTDMFLDPKYFTNQIEFEKKEFFEACTQGNYYKVSELLPKISKEVITQRFEFDGSRSRGKKIRKSSTLLHIVCENGDTRILNLLLQKKPDLNILDDDNNTSLNIFVKNLYLRRMYIMSGLSDFVESLLKNGTDPNIKNNEGDTALILLCKTFSKLSESIFEGYFLKALKLLLQYGANINEKNNLGNTALIEICNNTDCDHYDPFNIVDFLLKNGAQVDAQNNDGSTALMFACKAGCLLSETVLLAHKANVSITNLQHVNALMYACASKNANIDIIAPLIPHLDINAVNIYGDTALMIACNNEIEKPDVVSYLTDHNATTECKDIYKNTPLLIAIDKNFQKIFRVLLKKMKTNPQYQYHRNSSGDSPLHLICKTRKLKFFIDLLISKIPLDFLDKNNDGKTPLDYLTSEPEDDSFRQVYISFMNTKKITS